MASKKCIVRTILRMIPALRAFLGRHSPGGERSADSTGRRLLRSATVPAGESWYKLAEQQARENEGPRCERLRLRLLFS